MVVGSAVPLADSAGQFTGAIIGGVALIAASIVAAGFQAGDLSTWGMRLLGAFTTVMAGVPYTISAKRKHKISALAHARDMMARAGQDGATDKIRQCAAQAQEWLWEFTQRNIRSFG